MEDAHYVPPHTRGGPTATQVAVRVYKMRLHFVHWVCVVVWMRIFVSLSFPSRPISLDLQLAQAGFQLAELKKIQTVRTVW